MPGIRIFVGFACCAGFVGWFPMGALGQQVHALAPPDHVDWLIDPAPFKASVLHDPEKREIVLANGLVRRTLRIAPNVATVDYQNQTTGEQLLRATGPEARVTIDGKDLAVGGLSGQPVGNYLKQAWIDQLTADPAAYQLADWKEGPIKPRFAWKKRPEWLAKDLPWPPAGRGLTLRFVPPSVPDLPEVDVHYAIYDGIPLIEKWLTVRNTTNKPRRVDRTLVETLKVRENESSVETNINWEPSDLYVETDHAYLAMTAKAANRHSVKWLPDASYKTQVNYNLETPCILEVAPEFGPGVEVPPGGELVSIRAFELFHDSTDRERRGLAQRRMYRTIAPWTQENPVMMHLISNDPAAIRKTIDQAADVGVEMIILSFGSGMDMENRDAAYQEKFRELAGYAGGKGIVLGAYSLLASRGAATAADNCNGPGSRVRFGVMPCLGSEWGAAYLEQLKSFISSTGFGILEHDGSYPGDTCAATNHPGHHGLADSQWVQHQAITEFYQWCRGSGVYLNIPDWYYLNGGNKCGMGYRETNWSLPRAEQEIIERQNLYDGTWEKTPSMGWMFVPLTQYHGGGAAATIEPLHEHLDHYESRLANLFGAGVQACYRGPRIYDTEETKMVVKKWIGFYKQHREVLDADIVHLRRPDGRDWDGFTHVNPQGREKALAFLYNPTEVAMTRTVRIPLYHAGLKGKAMMSVEGASPSVILLDRADAATIEASIPAKGRIWVLFSE